ncbi:putative nuclease HARBI1 [Eupeodes corollae]|uniref:putative nuclease HARBI1 n=1 Tax=Eupeodes corollae TaxID=290404 RepID=UPI0024939261|nr:putative nuclease HARBI1 [Eupeodes corollae]
MSKNVCGVDVPVVLIGDSAFRFSESLMKPFPFSTAATAEEKNFNYSLSKCRRVVENCFGHLKARFRRIGKGLDNRIDNSTLIIKACCVLHNFMNVNNDEINLQWLQNTNNNPQRQQPEHSTQIDNLKSSPSIIRNAISMHLSRGLEVEEVAIGEVDSADGLSLMSNWDEEYLDLDLDLDLNSSEAGIASVEMPLSSTN